MAACPGDSLDEKQFFIQTMRMSFVMEPVVLILAPFA
jgi:hypothetical protein